jgi:coproporphyrinogen III oxidase
MERLDSYIESQTRLNESICNRYEKVDEELDEIKHWRTKLYGAKSASVVLGAIFVHSAVVLGSLIGIMTWFSNK